jgi:molybdopterin synthase catalytic subunit
LNELNTSLENGVDLMTQHSGVHEKGTFNLSDLINNTKKNEEFAKAGAIAIFIGVVRSVTPEGKKVVNLKMEAYEEKANEVLTTISKELSKKLGIVDVQIHHLLGEFNVGEDMVYVSVTGSHREEVFSVLREAVERYKKEAPVFKKEKVADAEGTESEYWVSEIGTHEN